MPFLPSLPTYDKDINPKGLDITLQTVEHLESTHASSHASQTSEHRNTQINHVVVTFINLQTPRKIGNDMLIIVKLGIWRENQLQRPIILT